MDETITPREVLQQVAQAIPETLRGDIIIVGSLAASYQLLRDHAQVIRTKDIDVMLSPHARAVVSATAVTEGLLGAGWIPQATPDYDLPATADTPIKRLPVVRLCQPGNENWFLELLGAPNAIATSDPSSKAAPSRLQTSGGHFLLPSFSYLGLAQFQPTVSEYGLLIAVPEMMALANLLHHPAIDPTPMSKLFAGASIKRSNKDLGRVVAMAFLADQQDEDALERWVQRWSEALHGMEPEHAERLLDVVPSGLHALLANASDIQQALHTVNNGLLTASKLTPDQFVIAIRRLLRAAS